MEIKNNKCQWFIGCDFKNCTRNKEEDSNYCETHKYVNDYTEIEKLKKK